MSNPLAFPYPETRQSQQLLVDDLDDAVAAGLLLLCAAPTGTGKTAAALYPLVRRAIAEKRKVFFVTAKNSQQTLALDTLERMLSPGSGGSAVQIRARARSCPLDGRHCRRPRCRYMDRFKTRFDESEIGDELMGLGVVRAEQIAERALAEQLCPFETSLTLAERATVVVSDFNYVFDPRVYLRRFFDESYDRQLLIVDEAHNLPKRAIEYYSPILDLRRFQLVADVCRAGRGGLLLEIAELLDDVRAHCERVLLQLGEERDGAPPWVEAPDSSFFDEAGGRVESLLGDYGLEAAMGANPPPLPMADGSLADGSGEDPLFSLLTTVQDFCRCSGFDPELFATLWEPERVRMLCLDPAPFLRERLSGFHAAVCMSATLAPLEFFANALGVDGPRCVTLELPSPFPRENRRLVAATAVDTTYKKRSEHAEAIARILSETMRLRAGNYLAFFSSFAYRDEVVSKLDSRGIKVVLQLPGMPADALLSRLRANREGTLLLCGVQGGVLSEGVDYPGDMAIGVFVIGPGLPMVSFEQELVRAHYDRTLGSGFEHAYLLPGLSRAVQAGGRAIRSETDQAFVMLIGRRFAQPLYQRGLPAFWREELVKTDDPVAEIRDFWRGLGAGAS